MGASFDDLSPIQNQDLVCVHDSRDPVTNDEGYPPRQDRPEILQDLCFGVGVDCAEGIVQDQHEGLPGQGPSQSGPLLLSA